MLYVFFGKDVSKVREKALAKARELVPAGAEVLKITADSYAEGMFGELAESVSLFGGAQVLLIDTPSSDAAFNAAALEHLAALRDSSNHFILIEGALLAAAKKAYTTHATHIEETVGDAGEKFNSFAITDALLNRDKKTMWLLLIRAREAGEKDEAIAGILFWQIKMLRLAARTASPEEAGQKPFVYNKAKRALTKFAPGELDALSRSLLTLYHEGHSGTADMSLALEQWVLRM